MRRHRTGAYKSIRTAIHDDGSKCCGGSAGRSAGCTPQAAQSNWGGSTQGVDLMESDHDVDGATMGNNAVIRCMVGFGRSRQCRSSSQHRQLWEAWVRGRPLVTSVATTSGPMPPLTLLPASWAEFGLALQ